MTIEIPIPFVAHKLETPPSQSVQTSKSARPAPRRRCEPRDGRQTQAAVRGASRRRRAALTLAWPAR
jgi:hypothetical protein